MKLTSLAFFGFGKMAEGIYLGLKTKGLLDSCQLGFIEANSERKKQIEQSYCLDCITINELSKFSTVLLCVKPQNIQEIIDSLKNTSTTLWISILAGTPLSSFEKLYAPCVRVMPNLAVTLGEGMSAIACNSMVSKEQENLSMAIFRAVGKVVLVPEEWLDIVTGISGSGPAFMYRLAQAISQVGVQFGMDEKTALTLIAQTMVGAGKMLLNQEKSPQELVSDVTSPGGTTAAGLAVFDNSNIVNQIQTVIEAAITRSIELKK